MEQLNLRKHGSMYTVFLFVCFFAYTVSAMDCTKENPLNGQHLRVVASEVQQLKQFIER